MLLHAAATLRCGAAGKGKTKKAQAKVPVNPYIQAALAECRQASMGMGMGDDGDDGDLSDLEDFIVCKPDRSYKALFARHYRYSALD